jgi:hypothetical protein
MFDLWIQVCAVQPLRISIDCGEGLKAQALTDAVFGIATLTKRHVVL